MVPSTGAIPVVARDQRMHAAAATASAEPHQGPYQKPDQTGQRDAYGYQQPAAAFLQGGDHLDQAGVLRCERIEQLRGGVLPFGGVREAGLDRGDAAIEHGQRRSSPITVGIVEGQG
jgi:hypothetical protein